MPRRHTGDKFNPLLCRLGFSLPPRQLMEIPHHKAALRPPSPAGPPLHSGRFVCRTSRPTSSWSCYSGPVTRRGVSSGSRIACTHPSGRRVEWCARVEWQQLREFTLTLTHASMLRMRRASATVPEGQATPPTPSLVAAMRFSRDLIEYETHLRGRMDDLETDLKMWTAPAHLENGKMWRDSRESRG